MLTASTDSIIAAADSFLTFDFSKDTIRHPVIYKARDSIIYDVSHNKVLLWGNAEVTYDNIKLSAYLVELDWTTHILTAQTEKDTAGQPFGDVVFIDAGQEYRSKKLAYNVTTEKGKVYQVRTREGDGYMHAEAVKRTERDEWYGQHGKYTTCDLEHPHFFIQARKMKMVPDKVIVTGPANLVVADVPTPLYVPFSMFPIKKDRKSGIIFPQYGAEPDGRGFFLRQGGYYFYPNDYIDLMLAGDIYSNGSFALRSASQYARRYKFRGALECSYGRNRRGDPLEKGFSINNDFRVIWRHAQDSRARPGSSFISNVDFGTSRFDRNFNFTNVQNVTNSLFNSNITYSKSWAGKPFNLSLNGSHSQSLITRELQVTFPYLQFGVSRITPFKPTISSERKKWYEDVGFSYRVDLQNKLTGVDSVFLKKQTFQNATLGILHNLPVNTSIPLFRYLTLQPQFTYNERWYFKTIRKSFSPDTIFFDPETRDSIVGVGRVITDTIYQFKTARDFELSANLTTRLFGIFPFKKGKIKAFRHVFTPQINVQYRPDFANPRWKYYRQVQNHLNGTNERYSIFDINDRFPGIPPSGKIAGIGLTLNNIFDMKVFSKKDTIKQEKKVNLLDNLRINTFYNFAADSLHLSPVNISGFTSVLQGLITLNMTAQFDPYATDKQFRKINTFVWQKERRLLRFSDATLAIAGRIAPKHQSSPTPTKGSEQEREYLINNLSGFYDFNIPWSLQINFNLRIDKGAPGNLDTIRLSAATFNFSFDVNVTKNWKLDLTSGYDLSRKDFIITSLNVVRNLHCWELRFQYIPYPVTNRSYNIQINAKSPLLQELRLTRKDNAVFNNFSRF